MTIGSSRTVHLTGLTTALSGRHRIEWAAGVGRTTSVWSAGAVHHVHHDARQRLEGRRGEF